MDIPLVMLLFLGLVGLGIRVEPGIKVEEGMRGTEETIGYHPHHRGGGRAGDLLIRIVDEVIVVDHPQRAIVGEDKVRADSRKITETTTIVVAIVEGEEEDISMPKSHEIAEIVNHADPRRWIVV